MSKFIQVEFALQATKPYKVLQSQELRFKRLVIYSFYLISSCVSSPVKYCQEIVHALYRFACFPTKYIFRSFILSFDNLVYKTPIQKQFLLVGLSGSGKTFLARVLAGELRVHMVSLDIYRLVDWLIKQRLDMGIPEDQLNRVGVERKRPVYTPKRSILQNLKDFFYMNFRGENQLIYVVNNVDVLDKLRLDKGLGRQAYEYVIDQIKNPVDIDNSESLIITTANSVVNFKNAEEFGTIVYLNFPSFQTRISIFQTYFSDFFQSSGPQAWLNDILGLVLPSQKEKDYAYQASVLAPILRYEYLPFTHIVASRSRLRYLLKKTQIHNIIFEKPYPFLPALQIGKMNLSFNLISKEDSFPFQISTQQGVGSLLPPAGSGVASFPLGGGEAEGWKILLESAALALRKIHKFQGFAPEGTADRDKLNASTLIELYDLILEMKNISIGNYYIREIPEMSEEQMKSYRQNKWIPAPWETREKYSSDSSSASAYQEMVVKFAPQTPSIYKIKYDDYADDMIALLRSPSPLEGGGNKARLS